MDILLTPTEWNAAAERGVRKWTDQLSPDNPDSFSSSAPFVYEEVCRAQVRKVWGEIQKGYYKLPEELVQALRAAGGEG